MRQNNFLVSSNLPPPNIPQLSDLPILKKLTATYKLWHKYFQKFPRLSRYTLGAKIDALFTELTELILLAGYAHRDKKLSTIAGASAKLDSLKFFLTLAWEMEMLEHKQYATLAPLLNEVGKMLGGWTKMLVNETPPKRSGGE